MTVGVVQEEHLDLLSLAASLEEDSPLVFLEKVHVFRERVDDFTGTSLPSALQISVTPRAVDYLHQHWPAVTLSSLDEAPVPKVRCCGVAADPHAGRAHDTRWLRGRLLLPLLSLLLVATLCWLGVFSRDLRGELFMPVWDRAQLAYALTQELVLTWCSHVFSTGEMFLQQMTAFFTSLMAPLNLSLLFKC